MNWHKYDSDKARHHERWKRRVTARTPRLVCQECRGAGGEVEPVLDFGAGPFFCCGFCEGTGFVDAYRRHVWLAMKAKEATDAK